MSRAWSRAGRSPPSPRAPESGARRVLSGPRARSRALATWRGAPPPSLGGAASISDASRMRAESAADALGRMPAPRSFTRGRGEMHLRSAAAARRGVEQRPARGAVAAARVSHSAERSIRSHRPCARQGVLALVEAQNETAPRASSLQRASRAAPTTCAMRSEPRGVRSEPRLRRERHGARFRPRISRAAAPRSRAR